MNDLRTAAQQALEAAENRLPLIGQAAIIDELNALRAALAQEEQAEPVAWMNVLDSGYKCLAGKHINDWTPLYTHPPRREWQSLTVEFIHEAIDDNGLDWHNGWTVGDDSVNRYLNLARAIEQALKEKNQ